jgi:hypothetical protein
MMRRYLLKALDTMVGLNLINFDGVPSAYDLMPMKGGEKIDVDVNLYKDYRGSIIRKIKKGRLAGSVKKMQEGLCFEIFNVERRKTFCFFERNLPLNVVVNRGVSQSFLVYQSFLDIIFLHSASVVMDDKVYLFVAPSGGGKTTVYSFAREKGLKVLDDEFCVIKRKKNRFYAGLFPCLMPKVIPYEEMEVGGIFFLNKSSVNKTSGISAIEATRRAMPEATTFFHDRVPRTEKVNYRKHVFDFLNLMFENVDFKLLDFKKQPDVFTCLR